MNKDLTICVPTRDGSMQAITTAVILDIAYNILKRRPTIHIGKAGNIPRARNVCMEHLKAQYPGRTHAWALWIDSDVLLRPEFAFAVARNIEDAEKFKKPFIANYRQADGQNVLMKQRSLYGADHYTDDELMELPPGAEIPMAGLGCVYLYTPLDYVWHADRAGEDVYFLLENPDVKLYYAKNIGVGHERSSTLWGPKTW